MSLSASFLSVIDFFSAERSPIGPDREHKKSPGAQKTGRGTAKVRLQKHTRQQARDRADALCAS